MTLLLLMPLPVSFFPEFSQTELLCHLEVLLLPFLLLLLFGMFLSVQSMAKFHQFLSIPHTRFSPMMGIEKEVRDLMIKTVMNFEY